MYRDDYARASMPMLPVIDKDGSMTGRRGVRGPIVPMSVLPMIFGMAGRAYGIGALVLGLTLVTVAVVFALKRSRDNARMLFLASITYLPLLLILMAVSRR
jgi:protoheme IX farnesyltransferase